MTTGQAVVAELDGLVVQFGAMKALAGITLVVRRGETIAVVGPSGAGKSTLLRVIAGMRRPSAGTVAIDGRDISALKPGRELTGIVGMMQQRLDLVPQLSVRHNVEAGLLGRWSLPRAMAGLFLPIRDRSALAAMTRVGLAGRGGERTSRLSGGEQQRVALARLLVQDPAVILADEPVASLDPTLAHEVLGLITGIAREFGKTVVASLHSPEMAVRHFDRIVGLRDGQIEFDLPSAQVTQELLALVYRDGRRGDPAVLPAGTFSETGTPAT